MSDSRKWAVWFMVAVVVFLALAFLGDAAILVWAAYWLARIALVAGAIALVALTLRKAG